MGVKIFLKILKMFKQIQYMRSILKKCSDFLTPGKYYMYNSLRAMSLEDSVIKDVAKKYFHLCNPTSTRALISHLLNKTGYYTNRNKGSSCEYEAFYTANNFDTIREIKLFSFKNKRVLTICRSEEDMHKQLDEYAQLKNAYNLPDVKKSETYERALEVAMISQLDSPSDSCALRAIARATEAYNLQPEVLSFQKVEKLIDFFYENDRMNKLLKILADRVDKDLSAYALPLCMQHGDLSKDNLLYGESNGITDYWWIDWEHARDRVFFYDYFFYIINSGIYGDLGPLHCYINGENDDVLNTFFAHFGLTFDPEKRLDYFYIFVICFLKERVCDRGNLGALERYCNFLDKYCHLAEGDNINLRT